MAEYSSAKEVWANWDGGGDKDGYNDDNNHDDIDNNIKTDENHRDDEAISIGFLNSYVSSQNLLKETHLETFANSFVW